MSTSMICFSIRACSAKKSAPTSSPERRRHATCGKTTGTAPRHKGNGTRPTARRSRCEERAMTESEPIKQVVKVLTDKMPKGADPPKLEEPYLDGPNHV